MDPERKAKTARILGYICVVAGAMNLVIAAMLILRGQQQVGFPLLGSGFGALTVGIIILTRRKQRSESEG